MIWRLLPFSEQNAALNMAMDESILEHIQKGASPPTIRFYAWQPSAITLGTFQCRGDEVNMEAAKKMGVDVMRRITGGGAVYHDREITYSILARESLFEKDILKSYQQICTLVINALQVLEIPAVFKPINDILVNNKKISGSAQTRRKGVLLQHGTILYDVNMNKMFSLLKIDKAKVSEKFISSAKKQVTSVREQNPQITKEALLQALVKSFTAGKTYKEQQLTKSELKCTQELVQEKYSSEKWNDCRG